MTAAPKSSVDLQGVVVAPGLGPSHSFTPGRSTAIKLTGAATGGSVMLFEQTIPAGTKSTFHRHRDSDEIGYVVSGELTLKIGDDVTVGGAGTVAFVPRGVAHAWKCTGSEAARVVFFYTPAKAGGLIEEQQRTGRGFSSMTEKELADLLQRYGWELLGPSPL
jgi:quercetin dioxygenase-like cupin family protein